MPIGRFLLFSILGSIPWNLALVTAGWVLGENYEALYEAIRPFEILIYVVVVLGGAFILVRWVRGRSAPRQV
jgi:membrane protein DedA with SNARE-associated domain